MMPIPNIFLDTSALFSGIWSATGGARMLLKLGEVQAIQLHLSSQVLTEIEGALRRKSPKSLGTLAIMLDRSRISLITEIPEDQIAECHALVNYAPDAKVLAAAWGATVDYFVTLDRQHFLNNERLYNTAPFEIGTPGNCLRWYRNQISSL